ncbi:MAG TPA: xanthine dehydrogenase family protein molybdopterin-binding subunit [Chloroflexota bacterium]
MLRAEDPRLLTGRGQFVADVQLPRALHLAFLRSPHPHARITRLDVSHACQATGVAKILTGAEIAHLAPPLPVLWPCGDPKTRTRPLAAAEVVRYVGEPLAVVAAASRYAAEDALDAIEVEYEPLPVIATVDQALADDAPLLYPEWGDNVAASLTFGDRTANPQGHVVVRERFTIPRLAGVPIEARGVTATYEPSTGELTVWASTQVATPLRLVVAETLGLPQAKVRVIAPDVGGGFGNKDAPHPEEVLTALVAKLLGRPVQWIEDRREAMLAIPHARGQVHDVELALDRDGVILSLRDEVVLDLGAHFASVGLGPGFITGAMLPGPYRVPSFYAHVSGVVTNKTPLGAYRGFGMPEATFALERGLDQAARQLGIDAAELRRRNLIHPEQMPCRTPTRLEYDSGDYPAALQSALDAIGYEELRASKNERRSGIGVVPYLEYTGHGPSPLLKLGGGRSGGYEEAAVRMDAEGGATVYTGMASIGTGIQTTMAQVAAQELGLSPQRVAVVSGDTQLCPPSPLGTVSSRSAPVGNAAVRMAACKVRDKLLRLAAHLLEAAPEDVELAGDRAFVRGTPDRGMAIADLAQAAHRAWDLPSGMEPGLLQHAGFDPAHVTFSYGVHAVIVELDRDTGAVELRRYVVVHDCGPLVNRAIVEGQIRGGVTQGLGAALLEELAFDEQAQPLTTSLMDYMLPLATSVPELEIHHMEVPSPYTPDGAKGCGESGTIPAAPAIVAAIEDALGVPLRRIPVTPEMVWRALAESS